MLQFACRAKQVRNKAIVNADMGGDAAQLRAENLKLMEEIQLLKAGFKGVQRATREGKGGTEEGCEGTATGSGHPNGVGASGERETGRETKLKEEMVVLQSALQNSLVRLVFALR